MSSIAPPVVPPSKPSSVRQFYALTKPRVVQLIVFCALIGMVLAVPGVPTLAELRLAAIACVGIWLVAEAAAAFNCLVEKSIDAKMRRTAWRPTARGELSDWQALAFSAALCAVGSVVLYVWVNPITMWLTFATFVGYAVVYTVILKPLTPQNIVIGGASGAMPPVLGWAAMTGEVGPEALILFLIIFLWTPPHFWALALYRVEDYRKSGLPTAAQLGHMALASAGVWLVAGAAAAFNCIVEQGIDAKMKRTAWRPTAKGELSNAQTLLFSAVLCAAGSALLYFWVNPLTMWLTFATFVGYAVVYTVILKPLTPQNIVIGGASGAMPPVLGWAAMTGDVGPEALILFLIIFLWTPPHFWALALYRVEDYRKSGLPMLPVTHGNEFTRLQILLYTLILFAACLMPFIFGMSSWIYLLAAVLLSIGFCAYAFALWREYSDALARRTFRFSLIHLSALFAALLVDHYVF